MNVIILGANGQLGYDLVKVLAGNLDRSFNIVGISRTQFDASYDMYKIEEKLLKYSPNIISVKLIHNRHCRLTLILCTIWHSFVIIIGLF
jgi:dTDP-4-dehydrorhamnose reductase